MMGETYMAYLVAESQYFWLHDGWDMAYLGAGSEYFLWHDGWDMAYLGTGSEQFSDGMMGEIDMAYLGVGSKYLSDGMMGEIWHTWGAGSQYFWWHDGWTNYWTQRIAVPFYQMCIHLKKYNHQKKPVLLLDHVLWKWWSWSIQTFQYLLFWFCSFFVSQLIVPH